MFRRITVEESEGSKTADIWVLGGNLSGTFHIGAEQDVNPIKWTNPFFR